MVFCCGNGADSWGGGIRVPCAALSWCPASPDDFITGSASCVVALVHCASECAAWPSFVCFAATFPPGEGSGWSSNGKWYQVLQTLREPSPRGKVGRSSGSDEGYVASSSPPCTSATTYQAEPRIKSILRSKTPSAKPDTIPKNGQKNRACVNHTPTLFLRRLK